MKTILRAETEWQHWGTVNLVRVSELDLVVRMVLYHDEAQYSRTSHVRPRLNRLLRNNRPHEPGFFPSDISS